MGTPTRARGSRHQVVLLRAAFSRNRSIGALNGTAAGRGFDPEDAVVWPGRATNRHRGRNALAFREIAALKDKLTKEKVYLEEEIQTDYNFERKSSGKAALKQVLNQVQTVAATDSTVLILGETGRKELIARALHNLSGRRERTL